MIKEAKEKAARWLSEFEGLFGIAKMVIIYGSAIRNYDSAKDIDLLVVINKEKYKLASKWIDDKQSYKPVHPLIMTVADIEKNLKNRNPAMVDAVKKGYVLTGYEKLVGVIKNVTSF